MSPESARDPLSAAAHPGDAGNARALVGISAFLIVAAGFLAYFATFNIPFHGEDQALFLDSAALHRIATAPDAFKALPGAPLSVFGLAVNWRLSPFSFDVMHAFNLLLHLANAVLLFLVCRRLLPKGTPEPVAMAAGLAFAVHPLTTDAVNCLAGRPALQGAFFGLLSLLLALHAAERAAVSLASLVCFALAVASWFPALVLPLVLWGALSAAAGPRPALRIAAPHAALAALFTAALFGAHGFQVPPLDPLLAARALARALYLAAVPLPLSPLGVEPASVPAAVALAACAVPLAGLLLCLRASAAGAALWWAGAAILAAALVVPQERAMLERNAYFALAGLTLLVPWLLSRLSAPPLRLAAGGIVGVLVLAGAVGTFQRTAMWRDPVTLWSAAAESVPGSPLPWRHIGRHLALQSFNTGTPEASREVLARMEPAWRRVLDLAPGDVEALTNVGMILRQTGRPDEALPVLMDALRRDPLSQTAALHVALLHEDRARQQPDPETLRTAVDYFERAQQLGPLPRDAAGRFALARAALGDVEGALPLLRYAGADQESSPLAPAFREFAAVAQRVREMDAAASKLLAEKPGELDGFVAMAEAALVRGHVLRASYLLSRVLARAPQHAQGWPLMGVVRARMNQAQGFIEEWGQARAGNREVWPDLARRCAGIGLWDPARAYLGFAASMQEGTPPAALALARIALDLGQPRRAEALLRLAAEDRPGDPAPWLELCSLALDANEIESARALADEAERRGAPPDQLNALRARMGPAPEGPALPERTVIR